MSSTNVERTETFIVGLPTIRSFCGLSLGGMVGQ
jgi:hypothetical protein